MRRLLLLLIVPALIVSTGCAYMAQQEAARKAKVEAARVAEYDVPREDVMRAVLNSLIQLDYQIDRQDETRGYFETKWASRQQYGSRHDVRAVIEIKGDRPYRLDIMGDVRSQEGVTFEPFEDEIRVAVYERLTED